MRPVRSVHLTNAWHGASGGIRTFYEAMLAGAERARRDVSLIVPGETARCETRSEFTRIHYVKAPRSPLFDRRYRVLVPSTYATKRSPVARILRDLAPDVVEISDKYVLPWMNGLIRWKARGQGRPTLLGLSCERMDDNLRAWVGGGPLPLAAARAYLRHVYLPLCDGHIANSEYTAEELRALMPADVRRSYPLSSVRIGPMGVDADGFSPDRRSQSIRGQLLAGAPAGAVLLVFAGRLSPEKHVHWLAPMMATLRARGVPARLVICGDGPGREALEREAAISSPGDVRVLGHLNRAALATVLASADIFVHPNPREPFGIGPLEAMASGTPVVLPRHGGVLTYANDDNSWLTEPSAEGLADGVCDVTRRPMLAASRRTRALADIPRWSWPSAIETYFHLYDTLHDSRVRRPDTGTPALSRARVFEGR